LPTETDINNKFLRVLLASRRAKQLINGDKKRVELKAENPLTIALEEINTEKIDYNYIIQVPLIFETEPAEPAPKDETAGIASLLLGKSTKFSPPEEEESEETEENDEEDLEEFTSDVADDEEEDLDEELDEEEEDEEEV